MRASVPGRYAGCMAPRSFVWQVVPWGADCDGHHERRRHSLRDAGSWQVAATYETMHSRMLGDDTRIVSDVWVRSDLRGIGLGTMVMDHAITHYGHLVLVLYVAPYDHPPMSPDATTAFYRRRGFELTGQHSVLGPRMTRPPTRSTTWPTTTPSAGSAPEPATAAR